MDAVARKRSVFTSANDAPGEYEVGRLSEISPHAVAIAGPLPHAGPLGVNSAPLGKRSDRRIA
jgi:hypothetical protein